MNNQYGQRLVAHRGYSSTYPENTLLAVESALSLGARYVEVDIQLSVDLIPIVIHDNNLQRTANQAVDVMDYSYKQLQNFSVHEPGRFGNKYLPQRIPTLQTIMDSIKRYPQSTLFIEGKRASIARFGVEVLLDALMPIAETCNKQCVLISFDYELLHAAKQRRLAPIGWVVEQWEDVVFRQLDRLQPDYLFTDYEAVPANWKELPPGPWQWAVYTVDDAELALAWLQKGAALVETNNFGVLIKHPLLSVGI